MRGMPAGPGVNHIEYSDTDGTVRFAEGRLSLYATTDALTLRVEAADDEALRRLQDGIAARLQKIGRRDGLTTSWQELDSQAEAPADSLGGRRRPLAVVGLAAAVALIATVHLGLGGAALASTAWTALIGNVLVVALLGALVFIVAHLFLGRFAFRRRK
jgi:hypothetical protein